MRAHVLALAIGSTLALSCIDPVHDDRVKALGGEDPNIPEGPRHRAGQPCTVCHGGKGPGPDFSIGGTVYQTRNAKVAAPGVSVEITASNGERRSFLTNDVGNFYAYLEEWDPPFPLHVAVVDGSTRKEMLTRVGGDGGCAFCHRDPPDDAHVNHVFVKDQ